MSNAHRGVLDALAGDVGDVQQAADRPGAVEAYERAKVLQPPHLATDQRANPEHGSSRTRVHSQLTAWTTRFACATNVLTEQDAEVLEHGMAPAELRKGWRRKSGDVVDRLT